MEVNRVFFSVSRLFFECSFLKFCIIKAQNNNIQTKPTIKSYQETEIIPKHLNEHSKVDLLEANNNDKTISINSVLSLRSSKQEDKAEITNLNNNWEIANLNNGPE